MAPGWVQQGLQLPKAFRDALRTESSSRGHASIKTLGSMAVGILLGMPPEVRHVLYLWTHAKIIRDGDKIEPRDVYSAYLGILAAGDNERARIAMDPGQEILGPDQSSRSRMHSLLDRVLASADSPGAIESALTAMLRLAEQERTRKAGSAGESIERRHRSGA
jgi:hypothetical protein